MLFGSSQESGPPDAPAITVTLSLETLEDSRGTDEDERVVGRGYARQDRL